MQKAQNIVLLPNAHFLYEQPHFIDELLKVDDEALGIFFQKSGAKQGSFSASFRLLQLPVVRTAFYV